MDKESFSALYNASRKELYGYCRKLCGNSHDADDLMQQTYLKAWENFDKFDGRNLSSWLCSIARNTFLNNLRNVRNESLIDEYEEIPDNSTNPEFITEKKYIYGILLKALKNYLSPAQRMTVILYYYDEKSISEISEIMHCPKGTVESRLCSAREKLRRELKKSGNIFTYLVFVSTVFRHKLKNIHIPVNARITVSAVMTAAAMVSVSMASIPNENKLPHEIIRLESTSASEYANIRHINNKPTENKEETTMKKQIITAATAATMALTGVTAFQADAVSEIMTAESEIMTAESENPLYGDANNDKGVSISDSVAILQYVANESKYPIADETKPNADVFNPGDGITGNDANSIMKLESGVIETLPEYPNIEETPTTTTFTEDYEAATTTTTAVINTVSPKRTQGPDFEAGYYLRDGETKWYDKGKSEYMAEFKHAEFEKYFNKFFKGQENLISDTALYERILANLPVNFFPYMKTELLKIAYNENSLYGPTYITEEKLPDLLRISAIRNDARWVEQWMLDECAEIVHNEFSDYVTGTYEYAFTPGVEEYEGIMKYDSLFPMNDYCYRYYFIGDDNEENTRIAEEIITRLREAMTEKYGDCALIDGDIWLDCYGVGTYSEWGLDDVYYPPENGYYDGQLIAAFTSIKNIYFSPDGENITYWDISDEENEIIS